MNYRMLLISALILSVTGLAGASGVGSFLASYNISSSTISALTYYNITYSGHTYVLAYLNGKPTFLVNTSESSYQFVTDPTQIYDVIQGTIINNSLAAINTTFLYNSLKKYNDSVSHNITDCLTETGLVSGQTCTIANFCQACLTSPVCSAALLGSTRLHISGLGYGSSFEYGIVNFENNITALDADVNAYYTNVSGLNSQDALTNLANLKAAFSKYSTITQNIYNNPIFPPPATADYSQCGNYGSTNGSVESLTGPWYCSSVGLCTSLPYNYTLLGKIQGYMNVISALPLSPTQITSMSQNISTTETAYVGPILTKEKYGQLQNVLSTTLVNANVSINNAQDLLTHLNSTALAGAVASFKANYSQLLTNYLSLNITKMNATLKAQYARLQSTYAPLNATYSSLLGISQNNTMLLLELQSSSSASAQASQLAFQQAELNAQLSSKVSNVSSTKAQLSSLNGQIKAVQPFPDIPQAMVRAIDQPVAAALLGTTGYTAAVQSAPLYSIIPSVIIGILFLLLVFMFHRYLHRHSRIRVSRKTSRNWQIVFAATIVVVILYILATYFVAAAANASAPLSIASSAISTSKTAVVAINGPSNPELSACASKIYHGLIAQGKTVTNVTINGNTCSSGSSIQTTNSCMSAYASRNIPVIMLTNSTNDSVTAYSYFGTVLSQSGTPQFTGECLAYLFTR